MNAMTEVRGFEQCSGATDVRQMFTSCGKLESIFATNFDTSAISTYTSVLYGCNQLLEARALCRRARRTRTT